MDIPRHQAAVERGPEPGAGDGADYEAERRERDLLRMLFDAMPQLGWTALPDGYIDYYNRGWYEYTGTDYEQMRGWGWTEVHDPRELPRVVETWKRSLATGTPWQMEFPLRRHDGAFRWFLSRATPIHDSSGKLVRWVGINTDIDDQKRAERKLAELDRAKTLFFSNVSHELRTPLTLILGPMEEALRAPSGALAGASLGVAHRNALRLLKLVNALLDFARIEAGRAQASFVETDLARLTRDLASAFESAVRAAGIRYEVACEPSGTVWIDRDLWEKVVLNLLSNALKYTFEGRIAVRLRGAETHVELAVTDTGAGIPAEELPRIFERFHRVQGARARTHEGSGIGLALVQEIVRMHGGTIEARSEVDRGTTFIVRIPRGTAHLPAEGVVATRAPREAAAAAAGAARAYVEEALRWLPGVAESIAAPDETAGGPAGHAVPAGVRGAHVLVVEDNADMREYIARLLAGSFRVEAVGDGAAALRAARRARPDLVITDVMMPVLDGMGLVRELRADAALADLPVLMLSARAGEEALIEGLQRGADDYLVKPFSARELLARVVTRLEIERLRATAEQERRMLRLFVEHAPAALAMFDREMRYVAASRRWRSDYDVPSDFVGRSHYEVNPDIPEKWREVHRRALAGEVLSAEEDSFERAAGWVQWTRWEARPWYDRSGVVGGIIIAAEDITERHRVREALVAAREQAESASRAKDEFLAMLGHELRNPLSPIMTALHLMRLRAGDVCERERGIIERQAHHMLRLVEDLLDVSRIARGQVKLARAPIEVSEVVAKAIEMASPLFERAHHHLQVDVPRAGLLVDADEARLAQVVSNLLTNAAKYTPDGGYITVSARRERAQVAVRVTDTGSGIPAELLPSIFDRFVQGHQGLDRSQGGLGLGLAIVKNLVEMHGGAVRAESPGPGRGSTFTVTLPLSARVAEAAREAAPARLEPAAPARLRLLIVDDNQDSAEMMADALALHGYESHVVTDPVEALSVADVFAPDAALLDIGLPVMDGYELGRRLREGVRPPAILVAITGYGEESDRRRSEMAGFHAHFVKPLDVESLVRFLESVVPGPAAERHA